MTIPHNIARRPQWIVLLTALLFIQACGQGGSTTGDSGKNSDHTNSAQQDTPIPEVQDGWDRLETMDYLIDYPQDWTEDASGSMGTLFTILSPLGDEDFFQENVNLVTEDLRGIDISLQEYADLSIQGIMAMITDAKVLNEKISKSANGDFYRIDVTGSQGIYDLQFVQYYIIHNATAYVLTLTTDEEEFSKFEVLGVSIMDSFRLK